MNAKVISAKFFLSLVVLFGFGVSAASAEDEIDFVTKIQPILETSCVGCHKEGKAEGGLRIDTKALAFAGGDSGTSFEDGNPDGSLFFERVVLPPDDENLMPPKNSGGPLPQDQIDALRLWIKQGPKWPDGVTLKQREKSINSQTNDDMELIKKIHAHIVKTTESEKSNGHESYAAKVPLTGADYAMVAVPGGEFTMGSPESEAGRSEVEGPQTKVKLNPFWIGKYEVSWNEYEPYMITAADRRKNGSRTDYDPKVHTIVDAVSQPTKPYTEMSFGMGQKGYPAISMTMHGANKYCQWLSAQTGHFYRLPTEAEWEYACRAGTTTAFSFGDDPKALGDYAWYYKNSNGKYQKIGEKKPNPWGIHDMHGNVMEWTMDQYYENYFTRVQENPENPFMKPSLIYPHSVRGGGWDSDPEQLRSAARLGSDPVWKHQDPQLPKSIWYLTDAQWLGFRIVRPAEVPTPEEMYFYWNCGEKMKK